MEKKLLENSFTKKAPSIKAPSINAFSIIEMSIVIVVISILIGGISASKLMINKARLANAQSLTQNSIVNNLTEDLVAWFETSLETSFIASEAKNDLSYITLWRDNNKDAINRNNATASTPLNTANQPIIVKNVFYNSIPALRFSGAQYLNYDGTALAKTSYTIFVVEMRRSGGVNFFMGGSQSSINSNLQLGYISNTSITQAHYQNDMNAQVPSYQPLTPTVHRFVFFNKDHKLYSNNGLESPFLPQEDSLTSYNGAQIGANRGVYYYNGDLAEIIIFKTSLKNDEIKAIEKYLGAKYGIKVE